MGSPGQIVEVLIDTGSSDLWLLRDRFHADRSSSLVQTSSEVNLSYLQGIVEGDVVEDDVSLAGVTVTGQPVVLVRKAPPDIGSQGFDGLIGLGLPQICRTGKTILERLREQCGVSKVSLKLTGTEFGSTLVFGEPQAGRDVAWESVVWGGMEGWTFNAALTVGPWAVHRGVFVLDSGTSFLGAPPDVFHHLLRRLLLSGSLLDAACVLQQESGIVVCPCSVSLEMSPIVLHFGGAEFQMGADQLLLPVGRSSCSLTVCTEICELQVRRVREGVPFILGDTFLRTVTAIFDPDPAGPRVGLAADVGVGSAGWIFSVGICAVLTMLVCILCRACVRRRREIESPEASQAPSFQQIEEIREARIRRFTPSAPLEYSDAEPGTTVAYHRL